MLTLIQSDANHNIINHNIRNYPNPYRESKLHLTDVFHSNSDSDPKPKSDVQPDPNDEHGPDTYAELVPNPNTNHNPKHLPDKELDPDRDSMANPNLDHKTYGDLFPKPSTDQNLEHKPDTKCNSDVKSKLNADSITLVVKLTITQTRTVTGKYKPYVKAYLTLKPSCRCCVG